MNKAKQGLSWRCLLALAALLTLASAALGLCFGSVPLSLGEVVRGLASQDPASPLRQILYIVRLPHVAACFLAGAGLAVSGVLLQTATGNPLAGPNIIGVNAGAGFATVLGLCLAPMAYRLLPVMAFAGALACALLTVAVAGATGGSRHSIVLAGVAVSSLLSAGISMLKLLFPELSLAYNYFSVGGVSGVGFGELVLPGLMILAVFLTTWVLGGRLNLLCLGDALAGSLGVRVKSLRAVSLILASACAGAAVSFAGLLGFVGLMVPHMGRRLLGSADIRKLLPLSALLGASLVILADLLGRVLFAPSEIPAGIVTAFIGAPFFFVLLLQRGNRL